MSIRAKVVLLVLPLIVAPLLLTGFIASLSARNGITSVATSLLAFKMDALLNYANSQWSLLVENNFVGNQSYVNAARTAVSSYARTLVRNDSELIFAIDANGKVAMSTGPISLSAAESQELGRLRSAGKNGWVDIRSAARVAQAAPFEPFGWFVLVSEKRDTFYQATTQIFMRTGLILSISLAIAIALLVIFSFLMTQPLRLIAAAMRDIMNTSDLSKRVEILYRDETGDLGHSFNLMTGELDKAYQHIKGYALQAAIAEHKEKKIRKIFEKYVPPAVIQEFERSPESMLVGEDRICAVLFSDIRSFTTISEGLLPAEVVESLNDYFERMVDIIFKHNGTVDKYIGDAIMAIYGAPVRHEDDGYQAVMSGLEMLDALRVFNAGQVSKGRSPFRIGIGIAYGQVTVGNIGSYERKMDYTVIGSMVNLASRLEGLTKVYKEQLIVSEYVMRKIDGKVPCRQIDKVQVKGKTQVDRIYAPHRDLTPTEAEAWKIHERSLKLYYDRDFPAALEGFSRVRELLPDDICAGLFIKRCQDNLKTPPPDGWTGAVIMTEK